jgi:glutamate formiminotransferase
VLVSPVNVSEGRDGPALEALVTAAGPALLDLHRDPHHHRSVLTLAGSDAVRAVAVTAVKVIDLRRHSGVHPRLGALDVVPFVPFGATTMAEALQERDAFVAWAWEALRLPALPYGEGARSLPEVRRRARMELLPHPTAGAVAVGARGPLVAYNVWLAPPADLAMARRVAAAVRDPGAVRALGLPVGDRVQVSMNLIDPLRVGPAAAYDAVAALAPVDGAELVGLVPEAVLRAIPEARWSQLDLAANRAVEPKLSDRPRAPRCR